jgi:hypothetical protein
LLAAGFGVEKHTGDGDLADLFDGFALDMREFEAHRLDPGLEQDDIDAVGHYLGRLNDDRFARYGLGKGAVATVRKAMAVWPRP